MMYTIIVNAEELHMLIRVTEAKLFDLVRDGGSASEMKQVLKRIDELSAAK
ncbi:MAG: hypothetical protein Dbin4_02693 [Alphaproteobacteria bacterium]|nr:hypothetical protein [Alphaproteobacteria bacterium]